VLSELLNLAVGTCFVDEDFMPFPGKVFGEVVSRVRGRVRTFERGVGFGVIRVEEADLERSLGYVEGFHLALKWIDWSIDNADK